MGVRARQDAADAARKHVSAKAKHALNAILQNIEVGSSRFKAHEDMAIEP